MVGLGKMGKANSRAGQYCTAYLQKKEFCDRKLIDRPYCTANKIWVCPLNRLPRRYCENSLFCTVWQYRRGGQTSKRFKFYDRIYKYKTSFGLEHDRNKSRFSGNWHWRFKTHGCCLPDCTKYSNRRLWLFRTKKIPLRSVADNDRRWNVGVDWRLRQ